MSKLYGDKHRQLQDEFDNRKLADIVENAVVRSEINDEDKAFIESRDMFFLSTIDHLGRPSVSYKGGDKGFIRVIDKNTLVFPSYDGNGMFLSMGNINCNNKVGLLLIDFEQPHRLRAYGEAVTTTDDSLLATYKEAQLLVKVSITDIWRNCPRYIHKYKKLEISKYVPQADVETPLPDWKKLDLVYDTLSEDDKNKIKAQGGTISLEELKNIEQRND